jgi:diguanylate cyclase (GGDEF)-like protein
MTVRKRKAAASLADQGPELQHRRLRALFEACQALSTSLVLEEVMDLICKGVDKAFGLTSVDIYEYHAARDEIIDVWSFMPYSPKDAAEFVGTVYSLDEHPNFRRAFDREAIVEYHIDDDEFRAADPALWTEMDEWGEKSIIEVALVFGGENLGLLSVGSTERVVQLDEEEKELLRAFAATAATAIRNARLYRQTEELAVRDGLTGLFNHRYFYERLQHELARGRRYGTPVSLLMIDVDDFKKFNDTYGHPAGDQVLRAVAGEIEADIRRELDIACRYGGEEFAVILPNTPVAARMVGDRLCRRIAATRVKGPDGGDLGAVTVSIGVAVFPGRSTEVNALVAAADEALYRAKGGGKDRVEVAAGGE